jgi:hypothetical protein
MYIPRETKITTILGASCGIAGFVFLFLVFSSFQTYNPSNGFDTISLIIFLAIAALVILLVITLISLSWEIRRQREYLRTVTPTAIASTLDEITCPRCGSHDVYRISDAVVTLFTVAYPYQMRCKKCGTAFNKETGEIIVNPRIWWPFWYIS